jgi:hypothetical protein
MPQDPDEASDLPRHLDVDVANMVEILAQRFHENPLAGLREAVQNAVDAVRDVDDPRIEVDVTESRVEVWDNGAGMSPAEARERWARVFDSAKAGDAEAIGEFGVGRFALMGLGTPLALDTHDGEGATRVVIHRSGTLEWGEGERTSQGTTVAVEGDFGDLVEEALPYVRRVAAKRPEPILVNGEEASGDPFSADSEAATHAFRTELVEGALGARADAAGGEVDLYHRRLYVDTIHPEPGVVGEVNCDALNLVATRDGVQEDEAWEAFRETLDEQVGELWAKVARGPDADRFARHLFRRAREADETELVERIPVERLDGRRQPWEEVVAEARKRDRAVTYFSGRAGGVVQEAVERGVCVAVRVTSGDARLALHRDAQERGLESIYREDALRRRLQEEDEATVVEGGGSGALADAARDLLAEEVKNLEVLFVRDASSRANLTGNVLELNVEDDLVSRADEVAEEDRHLAQALLAPVAARELARRDLDRDRHDVHDERFARREEDVRDRLLEDVAADRLEE